MNGYPAEHFFLTVQNIEDYLLEGQGHGAVVRTPMQAQETGFLCKLAVDGNLFFLRVRVDRGLGFVLCDLYPTLKFPEEKLQELSGWCIEQTAQWRAGSLQMDFSRGTVFAHVETAFRDGAVSRETIAYMEQLLLSVLLSHYEELTALAQREE